jgi:hypothetical protein
MGLVFISFIRFSYVFVHVFKSIENALRANLKHV